MQGGAVLAGRGVGLLSALAAYSSGHVLPVEPPALGQVSRLRALQGGTEEQRSRRAVREGTTGGHPRMRAPMAQALMEGQGHLRVHGAISPSPSASHRTHWPGRLQVPLALPGLPLAPKAIPNTPMSTPPVQHSSHCSTPYPAAHLCMGSTPLSVRAWIAPQSSPAWHARPHQGSHEQDVGCSLERATCRWVGCQRGWHATCSPMGGIPGPLPSGRS